MPVSMFRWRSPRALVYTLMSTQVRKVAVVFFTMVTFTMVLIPTVQDETPLDPMLLSRTHTRSLEARLPPTDHAYLMTPPTTGSDHPFIAVFVQTHPKHSARRHRIRETWGNGSHYSDFSLRVIFSMGLQCQDPSSNMSEAVLKHEAQKHGDILLLNIADQYDSLTLKGLLTMKWIAQNFPSSQYILKTDDDVLLNMFAWYEILQEVKSRNMLCFIVGFVWINPKVFRSGKYSISYDDYPYGRHPSFCSGAGYVMSRRAVLAAIEAIDYLPLHVRDDPYFTGIIPQAMGIELMGVDPHTYQIGNLIQNMMRWLLGKPILVQHDESEATWKHTWQSFVDQKGRHTDDRWTLDVKVVVDSEKGQRFQRLSHSLNHSLRHECTRPGLSHDLHFSVSV